MSAQVSGHGQRRHPLTRERVLLGAVEVADRGGIEALTIRSLAEQLGVKPMSVYHHVANKSEILDGIVDHVFSEIDLPVPGEAWKSEIRRRSVSAREVLGRHSWAIQLLQSRTHPGPATLRHHDAVIGTLREAGFSVAKTAHAFALIDSYVFGFALSEAALPIHGHETVPEVVAKMEQTYSPADYPHLMEFSVEHILKPGYDFGEEFEYGLDLLLKALT